MTINHIFIVMTMNHIFNDKNFFVASMEDENHIGKNTSSSLESTRHTKEKSKHEGMNNGRKNRLMDRKYSER